MTTVGLLAADGLMCVVGLGLLVIFRAASTTDELVRRLAVAPLLGMAAVGVFGATLAPLHMGIGLPTLFITAAGAAAFGLWRLRPGRTESGKRWSGIDYAIGLPSYLALAVVCAIGIWSLSVKPLVEYDGWAMWGMKAHALALFGWADPAVFHGDAYRALHLDYPLVVPVLEAIGIRAAGAYESRLVVVQCLMIGIAGLLALIGVLHDRARPAFLVPTVLAIAVAPSFFGQLGTGYADVPLAVFIAIGLATSARWLLDRQAPWLCLATVFLSAGALTKNEGLLFACAALAGLLAAAKGSRRAVLVSGTATAIIVAPWMLFLKGPSSDGASGTPGIDTVSEFARARHASWKLLDYATDTHQFGLLLPLWLGAALASVVLGRSTLPLFSMVFVSLSLAGLTWVYATSQLDLETYLRLSADRVVTPIVLGVASLLPLLLEELSLSRRRAPTLRPESSSE